MQKILQEKHKTKIKKKEEVDLMCKINGKKLEEARTNAGMSQRKLAELSGVSQNAISHYETGKTNPSDETVERISMILKVSKDDIEIKNVGYDFLNGEGNTTARVRKEKGFQRYMSPIETEKWIESKRDSEKESTEIANALNSAITFGSKKYIIIDPTYIHVPVSHEGFIQVDPKDVTSWEFTECNLATYEEIDRYFGDERFFQRVKLYPSAGQSLHSLSHMYDITIVSHGYAKNLKLKEEWIKNNLFKEILDSSCNAEFIGVDWETHNDKSHVDMSNSIFVDDSITNLKTSNAKYKLLYGEYMDWNETNIDFIRCKNWLDLYNQICLIERF